MPLTNKQKQQALRSRRAKDGLRRVEYWLKESEKEVLDEEIIKLRKEK